MRGFCQECQSANIKIYACPALLNTHPQDWEYWPVTTGKLKLPENFFVIFVVFTSLEMMKKIFFDCPLGESGTYYFVQ